MARQRELGVLPAHPLAVVAHPDQRLAAVLDADADGARARVECGLDQLLHHGRGAPPPLAGGVLVGPRRGEHGVLRHGGSCGSRPASRSSSQPWMSSGRRPSSQRPSRRSTSSAAPASTVATALAPPYGATRTGVAGLTTTASACWRRSASRAPCAPAAAAHTASPSSHARERRRRASAAQKPTQHAAATRPHSPGAPTPTASRRSLVASGAGRSSRARRIMRSRGARRAATAHAAAALPSAPARYRVAPTLYQCAAVRGSAAARAANESAAARSAPAAYSADRKSTRLNSSHSQISYAVFCLKKKKKS